ncbi:MAG: hypothetical protein R3332_00340 [Pseudohongiellaceae bacterium]|nr:hypothetical protein [Pseudohongiellaceae bacterium]
MIEQELKSGQALCDTPVYSLELFGHGGIRFWCATTDTAISIPKDELEIFKNLVSEAPGISSGTICKQASGSEIVDLGDGSS